MFDTAEAYAAGKSELEMYVYDSVIALMIDLTSFQGKGNKRAGTPTH